MKTDSSELTMSGRWWRFSLIMAMPVAICLAFWLLPAWVGVVLAFVWIVVGSIVAFVERTKRKRAS
ncbi:MAG TPA: hypothetical protein VIM58_07860 [Candidatus Methylacidiphilales bacterium]